MRAPWRAQRAEEHRSGLRGLIQQARLFILIGLAAALAAAQQLPDEQDERQAERRDDREGRERHPLLPISLHRRLLPL